MKKDISVEELKMIQLKILDSIDDFCKKNGIQYFLFSGTLIGAVRHKGYIPWDDDVDICMKRKDYDRFFSEFNQQRRDTLKAISAEIEKNYYLASGKVIDTATVIEEENNCAMPIGVYVDIFPMDNLPADDKKLEKLNHRIDWNDNIKLANLKNVFNALAALFILNRYLCKIVCSNKIMKEPEIKSNLFTMVGWDIS